MKNKHCITISPDYDTLYTDSEGCCYSAFGDEIYNKDLDLGPRFSFVVPGIEEWLRRYEDATDFAETTTDPSFDWQTWHYEGLCFAKALWEQLPKPFSLYYQSPYEDNSHTVDTIEVNEDIDALIEKLRKVSSYKTSAPSFTDNIDLKAERGSEGVQLLFRINYLQTEVSIPYNRLLGVRHWLKRIIEGDESVCTLELPGFVFHFFRQTVGSHLEMGQFWIEKWEGNETCFNAYVNKKNFVKGIYLSLLTSIGFGIYDDIDNYPSGSERLRAWVPYNQLKSQFIESFITDQTSMAEDCETSVNETIVMFPDYGGCIFWDTMGVGFGDYQKLYTDSGEFNINVPGLEKWSEFYDNHDDSQTFEEYWLEGWNLAKQVRQQLPKNIDLFYMCFQPKAPDAMVDYDCSLPRIIVPNQE